MSKVKKDGAKFTTLCNQLPHLTWDTKWEKDIQERSNGNEFTRKPVWAATKHRHTHTLIIKVERNQLPHLTRGTIWEKHIQGKEFWKVIVEAISKDGNDNPII